MPKKVTLIIPEGYDDVLTVTMAGMSAVYGKKQKMKIGTKAFDLTDTEEEVTFILSETEIMN